MQEQLMSRKSRSSEEIKKHPAERKLSSSSLEYTMEKIIPEKIKEIDVENKTEYQVSLEKEESLFKEVKEDLEVAAGNITKIQEKILDESIQQEKELDKKNIDIHDIQVDIKEEKKPLETYSTTDTLPTAEIPNKTLDLLEETAKQEIEEKIIIEKPTLDIPEEVPKPKESFSDYKQETTIPQQKIFIHHEYPKTPDEVADLPTDEEEAPSMFKTSGDIYSSDEEIDDDHEMYVKPLGALEEENDEEEKEQEAPIFATLSATHAEIVTLSGGTSPTTPLSPRSPTDKLEKIVGAAAIDKEAIEEIITQDIATSQKVVEVLENAEETVPIEKKD
uniref:Uncharacterized protein n=1 Tax=Strigamia maritima TaxID=126957 RepID=T1IZ68_STRMM